MGPALSIRLEAEDNHGGRSPGDTEILWSGATAKGGQARAERWCLMRLNCRGRNPRERMRRWRSSRDSLRRRARDSARSCSWELEFGVRDVVRAGDVGRRVVRRDGGSTFRCLISSKHGSDKILPRGCQQMIAHKGEKRPEGQCSPPRRPSASIPGRLGGGAPPPPPSPHEQSGAERIDRCLAGVQGARGLVGWGRARQRSSGVDLALTRI